MRPRIGLAPSVATPGSRDDTKSGSAFGCLLFDPHGNTAGAETAAKTVSDAFRYDPYSQTIGTPLTSALATPWRYQGNDWHVAPRPDGS